MLMVPPIRRSDALLLHLSHGSVTSDSRVCRSLLAAAALLGWEDVAAQGVVRGSGFEHRQANLGQQVGTVRLWSESVVAASPRIAAYLALFEMNARMASRAIRIRPKVVHCHDSMVLAAGWFASLVIGCKLVYDAHELESQQGGSSGASRLCLAIERWCWKRISLLVSVSPSIIEWYQENLGPKRSVLVLNSPLISSLAGEEVQGVRRAFGSPGYFHSRFGIPAGTPVFVYLGLLVRGRGIQQVLEVFGRGNVASHVVFMGTGDTEGVEDHARRFPNIHLHQAVPHDEVVKFVREADCGLCLIEDVSLSDRLCLPNKLFEYAFAGVPMLASRLPEIARVVQQYGLGACCDNDADSIEAAVLKIEREGLARPEADLTELSWDTQAKRLQEAYRQLLLDGGAAVPDNQGHR